MPSLPVITVPFTKAHQFKIGKNLTYICLKIRRRKILDIDLPEIFSYKLIAWEFPAFIFATEKVVEKLKKVDV